MTQTINPKIESSWKEALEDEFQKPYISDLRTFLKEEKSKGYILYPPGNLIFNAFNLCAFDQVKVVILGQDPYHGPGQAHGLCFSVPNDIPRPPSLVNIFKELRSDLGVSLPSHGNLDKWARQGVLLLNNSLTVRARQAGSHLNKGWEEFTGKVLEKISSHLTGIVFLLWGRAAQMRGESVDLDRHFILKAPHPSPFSADRGFFGCRHFSKTNQILMDQGKDPIDWSLD